MRRCVSAVTFRRWQASQDGATRREGHMAGSAKTAIAALALVLSLACGASMAGEPIPYLGKPIGRGEGLLPERFAVVIGIDRYESGDALQNLNNASRDAEAVAAELKKANFYRFVLTTSSKMEDE